MDFSTFGTMRVAVPFKYYCQHPKFIPNVLLPGSV
jgi:hypothetical protein